MTRFALVFLVSVGCSTAVPAIEPVVVTPPTNLPEATPRVTPPAAPIATLPPKIAVITPERALSFHAAVEFPRRAVLGRAGPFLLGAGPDSVGDDRAIDWRAEVIVVAESDDRLDVVIAAGAGKGTRLLVRGVRDRFADLTTEAVSLAPTSALAVDAEAHVRVAPGVLVKRAEDAHAAVHVFATLDRIVLADGWAPAKSVGVSFVPDIFVQEPNAAAISFESDVPITNAGGERIAHFVEHGGHPYSVAANRLLRVVPGLVQVRLRNADGEVVGFVPAGKVKRGDGGAGFGSSHGSYASMNGPTATLRRGSRLCDSTGAVIGVEDEDVEVHVPRDLAERPSGSLAPMQMYVEPFGWITVQTLRRNLEPSK